MPAPRKPKKVFVQFAVAAAVAVVMGVGAIILVFTIIQGANSNLQKAKEEADKAKIEADRVKQEAEEKARLLSMKPISYKLVQANTDIVPGQPITKDMVTVIDTEQRPEAGTLSSLSQAIGKMVKSEIVKGDPLIQSKLLDSDGFLAVENGKRAITIGVDPIGGLNGAVSPGVRVDVLTTITDNDKTITRTLLQDIPVISVGNNGGSASGPKIGNTSGPGSPVTLAVTSKQAELLTLAGKLGEFHLTLRNFGDKKLDKLGGADLTELMTGIVGSKLKKDLPKGPNAPSASGFQNVNFSPEGNGLPSPSTASASAPKFTMQIYKGSQPETYDFQQ